ncbi:MAG: crossover junction endodeoxyribonuclease RuvC [Candidatus Sungbacteria bacterium RIFCSPLOWO2_02_FULL_51_17]|uniref:Crossover junction endodeoxyribonuclease RuvC n=1 Tax=Candidatus Sungbacteria bacterium RIFCSPHIGHO2_02_FULL_51_29 TaxID=1802273 RepID=A0A1G2KX78_9BACT|nr:MAG: crossover junction endodeoxyribonuclease RuvC [Candidatus Sungbacteria bacterium RIFCSPHIGHO2_01_FULL_51_22]OHA04043.1 MAG: crossover junction endodeoxyribonuclease RuvC [Candidatus Sungbacteria bacterium RIFCSPHIGHO2_02_FULL_51_29]OHA06862.1 MAG: crossover junction endodeoxyribonuclease RuvC [Candidatus Sungbacteria bacterium RIFCSPLOWO2_01_FULL_51_34]OHA10681.1 MAG: crossover junction endodeoxyribonuclease RuvC [Candidatus Sungbacteria bacterium RIFCSPLOWO2_02_FULL_51_17]
MKILGVDPGTSIVGYAVVERHKGTLRLIAADAIVNTPNTPQEEKLALIQGGLAAVIKTHAPDVLAVEKLFYFKNTKTVISVAEARGVILLTGKSSGLRVYEYTPLEIKMAVTGYGKADKKQVHAMTGAILKFPIIPKLDDITDAIAVAICAAHSIPRDPF